MKRPKSIWMMKSRLAGRQFFIGCWLTILCFSCQKDTYDVNIDEELFPYFESFQAEAAKRDIEVDFGKAQIEGQISTIGNGSVVGQCYHRTEIPNEVRIDIAFWIQSSHLEKEFIVFHELGHCFLQRQHDDSVDNKGICKSIMHSGEICEDNYHTETRSIYLNELFGY